MNLWERLVLDVLATWRITHLLTSEDGPADLIVRLRTPFGRSIVGRLLDCFNCFSIWAAAPAALFVSRRPLEWMFSWLALSGGACLLERMTQKSVVIQPLPLLAEGDRNDVLRSETLRGGELSGTDDGSPSIHIQQ